MFTISNDVWFHTFHLLTPFDFISVGHTCSFFHNLSSLKYVPIKKYWEYQCKQLWTKIDDTNFQSKNWKILFKSMTHFIASAVTGSDEFMYEKIIDAICPNVSISKQAIEKLVYNIKITVDDIADGNKKNGSIILIPIIMQHKMEMFKIYTCNMSDDELNKPLTANPQMSSGNMFCNTILHSAIDSNSTEICKYLLMPIASDNNNNNKDGTKKKYRDIDIMTRQNTRAQFVTDTPLTQSAWLKQTEIVSLLLQHPNMTKDGINTGEMSNYGPLHCACLLRANYNPCDIDNGIKIIKLLIDDERTNVNMCDDDGNTPLMIAVQKHSKFVQALLENKNINIDINIKNDEGNTALHIIAHPGLGTLFDTARIASARILLTRHDLDCNIVNNDGKTALQIAKANKLDQLVQMLSQPSLTK